MELTTYRTIGTTSYGEYKEKGSKFIGYALPFDNPEKLKEVLANIKKEHPSSRHICYAYKIGVGQEIYYRVNDDGEPSGSAGKPIYGQILSFELTNCFVAVVRYFGGTKLGVGGLITAYKEAAKLALSENTFVEKEILSFITIQCTYGDLGFIESIIKKYSLIEKEKSFQSIIEMQLGVPISVLEEVKEQLLPFIVE